jgi:hypothetical protein
MNLLLTKDAVIIAQFVINGIIKIILISQIPGTLISFDKNVSNERGDNRDGSSYGDEVCHGYSGM